MLDSGIFGEIYGHKSSLEILSILRKRGLSIIDAANELIMLADTLKRYLPSDPQLDIFVKDIEFTTRTQRCLKKENIVTVGDLVEKTERDILQMQNFGRKSLNEIKDILSDMGLNLGMKFR